MALTVPSSIYPSERRSLGLAKEATPGTPVQPAYTVPVKGFVPEDKVTGLLDESLRSAMAGVYGYTQGPYVADITIDASPIYGDTIGHFLLNIMGDYTAQGTQSGTITTTINNGPGYPAGTTGSITITSGSGFGAGYAQLGTTTTAEVVQILGATSTTATIATTTPTRLAHANAAPITQVTGPYTHVFSLLNGTGNCQPPTHTLTDNSYIPTNLARWYPYFCLSEMTITGNAEQILMWSGKGMAYANQEPGTAPTVSVSSVAQQPAWNSTVGIGGTVASKPVYSVAEWEYTITRVVEPYWTADGSQNPYVIGRGKLTSSLKQNFAPASIQASLSSPYNTGEWELLEFLNNNQPQVQTIATNGLSSTSLVTLQVDSQIAAYESSVIDPSKALLGYNNVAELIGNSTNVGNSAGYSPLQITLVNNQPTF
jgi:hypothetical protein